MAPEGPTPVPNRTLDLLGDPDRFSTRDWSRTDSAAQFPDSGRAPTASYPLPGTPSAEGSSLSGTRGRGDPWVPGWGRAGVSSDGPPPQRPTPLGRVDLVRLRRRGRASPRRAECKSTAYTNSSASSAIRANRLSSLTFPAMSKNYRWNRGHAGRCRLDAPPGESPFRPVGRVRGGRGGRRGGPGASGVARHPRARVPDVQGHVPRVEGPAEPVEDRHFR